MKLNHLSILFTDDCNFNCSYCYQKNYPGKNIAPLNAKKIVKYAFENSGSELNIFFSGGEPLLKFKVIEKCVFFMKRRCESENKKINLSIITNGSLINEEILNFLNKNHFDVQYSFDVYLKDEPGGEKIFKKGKEILRKLLKSENVILSTNTVFTPDKVDRIYDSVEYLYNEGVENIGIGIDQTSFWDKSSLGIFSKQLNKVKDLVIREYNKSRKIIVDYFNLKEPKGINTCGAASDRITITPDGSLYGCASFHYYDWENIKEPKENYSYGNIDDLDINNVEEIKTNYKEFRTDNFRTDNNKCFLCEYLQECRICPAQKYSYLNGKRTIFHVPEQVCELNKIMIDINREFQKEIGKSPAN